MACFTNSAASVSERNGMRSPYRRMRGGSPATKCRSEPRRPSTSVKNESISATGRAPCGLQAVEVDAGGGDVRSTLGSMLVSVTYFWNARFSIAYP